MRAFTGSADAGVMAYGAGSCAPVRRFTFSATTHAHHRLWAVTTLSVVVSVTDLTTHAAWILGLATVALVLAGWRKNARATVRSPRGEPVLGRAWVPVDVAETAAPLYSRPGPLRRIWAAVAGSILGVIIGAVTAIVVAFALGYLMITLSDILKS